MKQKVNRVRKPKKVGMAAARLLVKLARHEITRDEFKTRWFEIKRKGGYYGNKTGN